MIDLRKERMDRGLSLDQLSEKIDVPRNTIARVERGTEPVPQTKLKIADFYGHKVTDIWPVDEKAAV
ncbi:MAG: helix-turn-helix transcriptional regulator [Solirubrobacterales bacterium]|nr:helix-turn-helix transcriptional regulator [Solirubrobacterales bacterium]